MLPTYGAVLYQMLNGEVLAAGCKSVSYALQVVSMSVECPYHIIECIDIPQTLQRHGVRHHLVTTVMNRRDLDAYAISVRDERAMFTWQTYYRYDGSEWFAIYRA